MSKDLETLLEGAFYKSDGLVNNKILNNLIKEAFEKEMLSEFIGKQMLDISNLSKLKYFEQFMEMIKTGMSFSLGYGEGAEDVLIDKQFLPALEQTQAEPNALKKLFMDEKGKNYINVIPTNDGRHIALKQINKESIKKEAPTKQSLDKTTLKDISKKEMKEGLVCYFYRLDEDNLKKAKEKIETLSSSLLDLPINIINVENFGNTAFALVLSAVTYLNKSQIDKKEKYLFLDAISAAQTIKAFVPTDYNVVDMGMLYENIRYQALKITGIPADKWCPADIYLYKSSDLGKINAILSEVEENQSLIELPPKITHGLNSLFDGVEKLIFGVSLKEADAQHGAAAGFAKATYVGTDLSAGKFEITEEEGKDLREFSNTKKISNLEEKSSKYQNLYKGYKSAFDELMSRYIKKSVHYVSTERDAPEDPNKALHALICKEACFRCMYQYFDNFETIKSLNGIIDKYDNPLLALTAFGVSLSGFNPTFYKVQASAKGDLGHVTLFEGRSSLVMAAEDVIIDNSNDKSGFKFKFLVKMSEKIYETVIFVRFSKTVYIDIIVVEFKEK